MNPALIDPVQASFVGISVNAVATVCLVYLAITHRDNRFLLFWAAGTGSNAIRWAIHYFAETDPTLRITEAVLASLMYSFLLLGAYDILPRKPLRIRVAAQSLAAFFSGFLILAVVLDRVIEMFYGLNPLFVGGMLYCLWKGYRATRFSAFLVIAFGYVAQTVFFVLGLMVLGSEVRNSLFGPLLFLIILAGFVLLGFQRILRQRDQAQQALRRFFDTAPIPIVVCRAPDGVIEQFNLSAQKLAGLPASELVGKTAAEIGIVADLDARQHIYEKLAQGESVFGYEVAYMHGGKVRTPYAVTASVLSIEDGLRYIFVLYDLTEIRKAQAALEELNAVLERRVEERTAKLETLNMELDSFSYSVAHDLRAPVRAINGFSELVLESGKDKLDDKTIGYLKRIVAGGRHMTALIDDLLNMARLSKQEMRRREIDMSKLAATVVESIATAQPERRVAVSIQSGLIANGDAGLMRVVLDNLISNAWKFTANSSAPSIEVGAKQDEGTTVYYVRDNGVGFDMKFSHKLFAPFQRLHHRDEFEGTGIGLATVRKIIWRHGGRTWLDSKVNAGTTVFFTIGETGAPDSGPRIQKVSV